MWTNPDGVAIRGLQQTTWSQLHLAELSTTSAWIWRVMPTAGSIERTLRSKRMNRLLLTLALLIEVACVKSSPAPDPASTLGTYDYFINGPRREVRGVIRVQPDTVIVLPQEGYCRPSFSLKSFETVQFDCDGIDDFETFKLYIDRRRPAQMSKWMATSIVQRERTVCTQYTTTSQGQRVCAQYGKEYYDEVVHHSGAVRTRLQVVEQ